MLADTFLKHFSLISRYMYHIHAKYIYQNKDFTAYISQTESDCTLESVHQFANFTLVTVFIEIQGKYSGRSFFLNCWEAVSFKNLNE